ncbi:uncharacterized protein K444DRAFT_695800 [Hyaloscypha bicolor E]|uniref:Uncharacterized protein n=1 Tax=Hyaloscypha bicolor E TaxID=1095630 RepID=A0A2J6SXN1_9HELO|nr:uncharacterized protein K444DRAFT_695800 [Hyaloscypha bicolor E]PMD55520.1 hypothetical protein K444DRAFT_695800 [Hyaloscypha bicolor E]
MVVSDPEAGTGVYGGMVGTHSVGGLLGRILIVVRSASIEPSSASKGPTFMKAGAVIFLAAHVLPAVLLAVTLRDVVWVSIAAGPFWV